MNISQLVRHTFCPTDDFVYVPMGMTVNPIFYPAVCYIIA